MTRKVELDPRCIFTHHRRHEAIKFADADRPRGDASHAAVRSGARGWRSSSGNGARPPETFSKSGPPMPHLHVDPADLPLRFELKYGGDEALRPCPGKVGQGAADAYIKGNLDILLNLLEGRIDGDALFFTRGLVITGDTAAIVGLHNTLDREEIDLFSDITGMFGPFSKPVGRALTALGRARETAKNRMAAVHQFSTMPRLAQPTGKRSAKAFTPRSRPSRPDSQAGSPGEQKSHRT